MFAINAHAMPLLEAAKLTFSPEGRCAICNAVSTAKRQQENSPSTPGGKFEGKIFLFYQRVPAPVVAAPDCSSWTIDAPFISTVSRAAPPLPPPRALA